MLIVTDQGIINAGLLEGITASLKKTIFLTAVFDKVEPNPKAETIGVGVNFLKENSCDVVLGIGGGSSIDTVKPLHSWRQMKVMF